MSEDDEPSEKRRPQFQTVSVDRLKNVMYVTAPPNNPSGKSGILALDVCPANVEGNSQTRNKIETEDAKQRENFP